MLTHILTCIIYCVLRVFSMAVYLCLLYHITKDGEWNRHAPFSSGRCWYEWNKVVDNSPGRSLLWKR